MDFDQLLVRFFGTDAIADLAPDQLAAGVDRLRLQLGLERDAGRRFALWCLAYMLGAAPDLAAAFVPSLSIKLYFTNISQFLSDYNLVGLYLSP